MKKIELNNKLREYVRNNLSPTKEEQDLVSQIYSEFQSALGNCLLIGSYARFTAVHPLHDIDILCVVGTSASAHIDPSNAVSELRKKIETGFKNPTRYKIKISIQTHSIAVAFLENEVEKLNVDLVPAFVSGSKNEFGEDIYFVPEILNMNRAKRILRYANPVKAQMGIKWIKSDPRGYISLASNLNKINADFRKTVKFIKKWKHNCKEKDDSFKLKSFHIEQVVVGIFLQNMGIEIFDAVFQFFCDIQEIISHPRIQDRADSSRFIDEYLDELSEQEKKKIVEARDSFLIELEKFSENQDVSLLLSTGFYTRKGLEEQFLFDFRIPVNLQHGLTFEICGQVQQKNGFRTYFLSSNRNAVEPNRKINFRITANNTSADAFKWKVKNSDDCSQPRGEITNGETRNNPESTLFPGNHYVECYAIKSNICIARSRQPVSIAS